MDTAKEFGDLDIEVIITPKTDIQRTEFTKGLMIILAKYVPLKQFSIKYTVVNIENLGCGGKSWNERLKASSIIDDSIDISPSTDKI